MRFLPILPLLLLGFSACTQPTFKTVGMAEGKTLLAAQHSDMQIVDVRTPAEIKQTGIIKGAVVMDYYAPNFGANVQKLNKNRPVFLYCASGSRSAQAAQQLSQQGFLVVYNFSPGMSGWLGAGNPTVKQ